MRSLSGALLLAAALGCASSPAAEPASGDAAAAAASMPRPPRNPYVITRDELADPSLQGATGLEAVRRLRPTFLNSRGAVSVGGSSSGAVRVSIDGSTIGPLADLEGIRTNEIRSIRYLSASEATQRFGITSDGSPVIIVERM